MEERLVEAAVSSLAEGLVNHRSVEAWRVLAFSLGSHYREKARL